MKTVLTFLVVVFGLLFLALGSPGLKEWNLEHDLQGVLKEYSAVTTRSHPNAITREAAVNLVLSEKDKILSESNQFSPITCAVRLWSSNPGSVYRKDTLTAECWWFSFRKGTVVAHAAPNQ